MGQEITKEAMVDVLRTIKDPCNTNSIIDLGWISSIELIDKPKRHIVFNLVLGFKSTNYENTLMDEIKASLIRAFGVDVQGDISSDTMVHKVQNTLKPLPKIKNIIAVASGKGGVGKSTTAVNLALALHREGVTVGILDADIYGPSLPRMMGCCERPESLDNQSMEPVIIHGIQTMSIGYLIDEKDAAIWRAPMAVSALTQLLETTSWKDLDYLIIDMPPGTGDIQLTMAQKIPVAGSVIVTTPQDIALLDARKGINMFQKVDVPILGIVENMSTHICSHCQHEEAIFGTNGGDTLAKEASAPLLGKLPLDIRIRESLDEGVPQNLKAEEISKRYQEIAIKMMAELSLRPKDIARKFPKIVVENH